MDVNSGSVHIVDDAGVRCDWPYLEKNESKEGDL